MPVRSAGKRRPLGSAPPRIIAAFGDSFTYGDEVEADQSWPFFLEEALPDTQVLNFGVPSYGLDQAFMRYRLEAGKLEAGVVIMGFVLDDARRNTSSFRPFVNRETSVPLAKPRFVLEDDELKLIPNPLRRRDYGDLLRAACERGTAADADGCKDTLPFVLRLPSVQAFLLLRDRTSLIYVSQEEQASRFKLTARIFLELDREARRNGSQAVVLLMPTREELGKRAFEAYEEYFVRNGIRFIDATAALSRVKDSDTLFRRWGHYSPLGNRIVADAVRDYLQQDPSLGDR
jgi:hypothetical protein